MKLKHIFFTLAAMAFFSTAQAQVKVGANPGTIGTNSALEVEATNGNKMVVTKDSSKVGIGTATPTNKLHVTGGTNPLRIEGLQSNTGSGSETPLVIDANGVVKKQSSSVPFPTLRASVGLATNYDIGSNGAARKVPLNQTLNSDGNFSSSTNLYTVPTTGVYQISGTLSFVGTTSSSTVSLQLNAAINNQLIQLATFYGTGFAPGAFGGTIAGTVTIPLSAGATVGLQTGTCFNCGTQTYTGTANFTNLTVVKMN